MEDQKKAITARHKNLILEYEHITTSNKYSPFPNYDTDYVSQVKEQIRLIEENYER